MTGEQRDADRTRARGQQARGQQDRRQWAAGQPA